MGAPLPELGSEKFTRWAKAVWPYAVGIFGMLLILFDCVLQPPPDATSGFGFACITGMSYVGLNRFKAQAGD